MIRLGFQAAFSLCTEGPMTRTGHRTWCEDAVSGRADQQLAKALGAMRPHDNQINMVERQDLIDNPQCSGDQQAPLALDVGNL